MVDHIFVSLQSKCDRDKIRMRLLFQITIKLNAFQSRMIYFSIAIIIESDKLFQMKPRKDNTMKPTVTKQRILNRSTQKLALRHHVSRSLSKPYYQAGSPSPTLSKKFNKEESGGKLGKEQLKVIKQKVKKGKEKKQIKEPKQKEAKQPKQKKKKINYSTCLKELKPVNLQKEKQLFFNSQFAYNPFFLYPNITDLTNEEYKDSLKFQTADTEYLALAMSILQKSREIGLTKLIAESQLLTIEETTLAFKGYIQRLGIGQLLSFQFQQNTISTTSVVHNNNDGVSKILIGLPIRYRVISIEGVMNHQIGTHFLRKYNDQRQKWYKDRKKHGLGGYLQTQQGLAALNQLIPYITDNTIPPLLYRPALMYYCCYLASKSSFSEMFAQMQKYQPDPQIRWKECVRVKRGIADTSKPSGMYKDQIYFLGAIQILKNRDTIDFSILHCGKINVEDCQRMIDKGIISSQKCKLPYFINDMKMYRKCLEIIAQTNGIK